MRVTSVLATNGWDVLVIGVPSTIAAFTGLMAAFWSRSARGEARHAKAQAEVAVEQTASPNGHTTGEAVDDIRRRIYAMEANQAEFKESVRASRMLTAELRGEVQSAREDLSEQITRLRENQERHQADDDVRFGLLFEALGTESA